MLDSIYHATLKLIKNHVFGIKTSRFCFLFTQRYNGRPYVTLRNLWFYCLALYHPQTWGHVIKTNKQKDMKEYNSGKFCMFFVVC